jgi:hypothetical protein
MRLQPHPAGAGVRLQPLCGPPRYAKHPYLALDHSQAGEGPSRPARADPRIVFRINHSDGIV